MGGPCPEADGIRCEAAEAGVTMAKRLTMNTPARKMDETWGARPVWVEVGGQAFGCLAVTGIAGSTAGCPSQLRSSLSG
jgi:hypothetical protein